MPTTLCRGEGNRGSRHQGGSGADSKATKQAYTNGAQLETAFESVSGDGPVTLDLAQLTFIDSSGLHAIMDFARSRNESGPLILASPSATAKRALEIAGLEGQFGVEIS